MTTRARLALLVLLAAAVAGCDDATPRSGSTPTPTPTSMPTASAPATSRATPQAFRPASYDGWLDSIPTLLRPGRSSACGPTFHVRQPPRADRRGDLRLFVDDTAAHVFAGKARRAGCHTVTRVGNAVLLSQEVPTAALRRSLCVFRPSGCPVSDPDVPDGFPLASGLPGPRWAEGPGAGLAGPSRALPSPVWQLCDRSLSLPAHRDRVAAQWTNPEDYRSRQLVTFSDADAAHALVAELSAFYGSCPQQPTGFDYIGYQHAVSRPLGDEAAALYRVQEYQGAPGLGVDIMQVVRVGRAVLLDSVSNEGDARGVRGQLRRMTRASAPVVSGLCAWSDDGCPPPRGSITLGPDGVGAIRLGMSARAVRALGIRLHPAHNGTGCSSFIWRVEGHVVQGDLDPRIGVSMLIGDRLATPEGIGPGAPAWRAEAAYADGGHDAQLFVPSVPGRPDRSYRMELRRGSVASLRLLADDQHCAS